MSAPAAAPPILDLELRPHRSLPQAGFVAIMAALGAALAIGSVVFLLSGAWPVIGFLGLDVALIYLAFRVSYARGRAFERVRLYPGALEIDRVDHWGRARRLTLSPNWLRVEVSQEPGRGPRLRLVSGGQAVRIGAFLPPEECAEVADVIRAALRRLADPSVYAAR